MTRLLEHPKVVNGLLNVNLAAIAGTADDRRQANEQLVAAILAAVGEGEGLDWEAIAHEHARYRCASCGGTMDRKAFEDNRPATRSDAATACLQPVGGPVTLPTNAEVEKLLQGEDPAILDVVFLLGREATTHYCGADELIAATRRATLEEVRGQMLGQQSTEESHSATVFRVTRWLDEQLREVAE